MDFYYVLTLFQVQLITEGFENLKNLALENYSCLGVEEYTLSENEVDEILGDRSYSGGDLPQEVLDEVEFVVSSRPVNIRFFFDNELDSLAFKNIISTKILCEIQIEKVEGEDWNAEWKKHYSPIPVNSFLEIVPSWFNFQETLEKKVIRIYPGMGFGTGSHETTFLCLKLFSENIAKIELNHVLDFGSGSGILGITALKMNPEIKMDFYDIDPEANKNCFENLELNNLESTKFRLLLPEYKNLLLNSYDLIFANILQNILLAEADFLIHRLEKGGRLILSGLLNYQVEEVIDLYSKKGLKVKAQLSKNDWSALLLEK